MPDTPAPALPGSIAGRPPQQWIPAPAPVYLTGEESLRLTTFANLANLVVTLTGRVLRPDNTISRFSIPHTPNSNRTAATTTLAMPEGWLLGVEAKLTTGATTFGQVWAQLELVIGSGSTALPLQLLGNDFVSANAALVYPGGANVDPLDGAGNLRSITGATPSAGANVNETVPTAAQWELLAIRCRLITSAVVANRNLRWQLDDGANTYFESTAAFNQAASQTVFYVAAQGQNDRAVGAVALGSSCLPIGVRMGAGHRIRTQVDLIDVGDQIALVQYLVKERFDV